VLPELVWCGFGVLVMLMQPFVRQPPLFYVSCNDRDAGGNSRIRHRGKACRAGLRVADTVRFLQFLLPAARGHGGVSRRAGSRAVFGAGTASLRGILLAAAVCTAGMGVLASAQELLTRSSDWK